MESRREAEALRPIKALLYATRWAIILAVLLISQIRFPGVRVQREEIVIAVSAMALLTLAARLAPKRWDLSKRAVPSAVADILLVSVVVYFSDGIQSPFFPLYYVTVISAAATFGTSGALWAALAASLLSLGVEIKDAHGVFTEALVIDDIVKTFPYLFLVAVIAGVLSDRVRVLADLAATLRLERAASEREMEVARRIQQAQLPSEMPHIPGVEVAVIYKPAREVGGDLYDFYPISGQRLGIAVADVAGKGVPAALLVTSAKYAIREHFSDDLSLMMKGVDSHLLSVTTEDSFVTMLYGVLDLATGEFLYANAGHMPPIIVRSATGEAEVFEHSDPPLGLGEGSYSTRSIRLEPGDILVLYTDGVTDALAPTDNSIEELRSVLTDLDSGDLDEWRHRLAVRLASPVKVDDVTVVAVRLS